MLGRPLDQGVAADLAHRLGTDLSAVRVHTDDHAAASALRLGAAAYTVGTDIVFAHGHYEPYTGAGRRLLAHELAHVMQLGGSAGKGLARSTTRPADDHEMAADRVAQAALAGFPLPARLTRGPAVGMEVKPDPFDVLRAGRPLTAPQAEDMLRHYEALASAERTPWCARSPASASRTAPCAGGWPPSRSAHCAAIGPC
jgi:hypothetical protein